jgi:hypothetical protein
MTGQFHRLMRKAIAVLLAGAFGASPVFARDVFVLLSGGVSPFDNNYSQYLQARAMADFFLKRYPPDSVWIFFGAGNVQGAKPVLADVCQETVQNGVPIPSWLPGSLPYNLPARRSVFLAALHNQILPAITDGGTLFLFVGDHGSRTRGRKAESEIDLWSYATDPASDHGWREDQNETLPVSELRSALTNGIGKGRVVFCMTQCHAGGFHYLAIPHEMLPDPKWFTDVPEYAFPKNQPVFPNAAGFCATDEFSMAAGCDPDPDPARWAGYERFVPEHLLGINLFTLAGTGKRMSSFAEAHIAAVLQDTTIDKPASTSDQYLERWANLIETRLAKEPNLTSKARAAVTAYERAVDGAPFVATDPALRECQSQFRTFTQKICGHNASLEAIILGGTREQLEHQIKMDMDPPSFADAPADTNSPANPPRRGRGRLGGRRRLWRETIRPSWQTAVQANHVTNLDTATIGFEKHLLELEEDGENFFSGRNSGRAIEEEAYWESGFNDPQTVNFSRAYSITLWAARRHDSILAWAKTNSQLEVRLAAARLLENATNANAAVMPEEDPAAGIDAQTAAARALFYRRVLAAWQFLITLNERPALERLRQLSELERTSLP